MREEEEEKGKDRNKHKTRVHFNWIAFKKSFSVETHGAGVKQDLLQFIRADKREIHETRDKKALYLSS